MSSVTAVLVGIGATALVIFQPVASTRATAQVKDLGDSKTWQAAVHDVEGAPPAEREAYAAVRAMKPEGPVPRTSWDGKPDLNGVYYPYVAMEPAPVDLDSLYRPEVQALRKRLHPEVTPNLLCYPNTFPVSFTRQHGFAVFHAPGVIVAILEVFGVHRVIPIVEGSPKRNPLAKPSFQGSSVGHWEGDTLVVEVTHFNGKGWLFRDLTVVSDQLRMVERWTRPDARMIEYEAVAEDPKMLTGSWKTPKMRRGQLLKKDYLDFDPCLEDSKEIALTLEALKIDPAQLKLSKDVLLMGAAKVLGNEAVKRGTR
jgi:hypothetical protein